MTLNLLRQSRINPRLSAYAQLEGIFDYNKTPMAPPGIRVIAHDKQRGTWAPHGQQGWCVGPAMEHYRCYNILHHPNPKPVVRDTVEFFPTKHTMPALSSADVATRAARDLIQTIDPDNHFYGEGWNREDRGFEQANQFNMAGTEIATFNDRLRDGVRSAQLFSNNESEDGPFIQQDIVKLGMAGSLADYVLKSFKGVDATGSAFSPAMYAKDPADVINYVSKHDNETLWDQLQFNLPFSTSMEDRVRAQNVSQSIVLLSE